MHLPFLSTPFLLAVLVSGVAATPAHGPQEAIDRGAADRAEGQALFLTHCATCHGANARGDGPVASSLRVSPGDLTQFAKRNGGTFPSAKVYRVIEGRDVGAHGSIEMPVWGHIFRVTPPDAPTSVKARIDALVEYLESIQERSGHEDLARHR